MPADYIGSADSYIDAGPVPAGYHLDTYNDTTEATIRLSGHRLALHSPALAVRSVGAFAKGQLIKAVRLLPGSAPDNSTTKSGKHANCHDTSTTGSVSC